MSPHPGESPLPLWFGIVALCFGAAIALTIAVRVARERRARRALDAERPDPAEFRGDPAAAALFDALYLARAAARGAGAEWGAIEAEVERGVAALRRMASVDAQERTAGWREASAARDALASMGKKET